MSADAILGYCTNVHAGDTWPAMQENLRTHAAAVKTMVSPDAPLPVGLWLAHEALGELRRVGVAALADDCASLGLLPYTFNGFPFGNFHQAVVKHAVYEPAWDQPQRATYTLDLAELHIALAKGPCERSISTLPVGWGDAARTRVDRDAAVENLRAVAERLAELHEESGVLVHLDIEPEPGCIAQRSEDMVRLFEQILAAGNEPVLRRHLRVCHDVCHAAVMHENQADVLSRYRAAGIAVGKVQLSNALQLNMHRMSSEQRQQAIAALEPFAEDRYLHQCVVDVNGRQMFYEDLAAALAEEQITQARDAQWRVHYHLPLFLDRLAILETTQREIAACLQAIEPDDGIAHFEVETYTWNVLPPAMQPPSLAEGIARELRWASQQLEGHVFQSPSGERA